MFIKKNTLSFIFSALLLSFFCFTTDTHAYWMQIQTPDNLCKKIISVGEAVAVPQHFSTSYHINSLMPGIVLIPPVTTYAESESLRGTTSELLIITTLAIVAAVGAVTGLSIAYTKYRKWRLQKDITLVFRQVAEETSVIQLDAATELMHRYKNTFLVNSILYKDSKAALFCLEIFEKLENLIVERKKSLMISNI